MELTTVWFVLIAVLWIGYFALEGFDFGVGMLLPVLGRRRHRAAGHDQHHRPGLGRQRGVAARRRRRHLRGVPRVVRDAVQRLLPAAAADPARPDRARGRLRVPRQAPRRPVARPLGRSRSSSARSCRRCCGAWPSPTSCAASRSTRTRSTPAGSSTCSTPTRCSAAPPRCCCSSPTAPCSSRSRPTARSGSGPARWPSRLGLAAAVVAVVFLLWTQVMTGNVGSAVFFVLAAASLLAGLFAAAEDP